jgi:hypothetical protein
MKHRDAGTLEQVALPRKYKHYLSDIDSEAMTGICATCGPTVIMSNGRGTKSGKTQYVCQIRLRADKLKRKVYVFADGDTIPLEEATEARERLYKAQNGCCAICNRPESTDKALSLDHCHKTGEIRGLLCQGCNLGLGWFRDSPETLKAASEYLANRS